MIDELLDSIFQAGGEIGDGDIVDVLHESTDIDPNFLDDIDLTGFDEAELDALLSEMDEDFIVDSPESELTETRGTPEPKFGSYGTATEGNEATTWATAKDTTGWAENRYGQKLDPSTGIAHDPIDE